MISQSNKQQRLQNKATLQSFNIIKCIKSSSIYNINTVLFRVQYGNCTAISMYIWCARQKQNRVLYQTIALLIHNVYILKKNNF